jgi:hypothetical protein
MSFYTFTLDSITVKHQRGNIPDDDVVTFSVRVNQLDRGHGTAVFPDMASTGTNTPAVAVPPDNRFNTDNSWNVGPFEILPGDLIDVIYTATNISDEQLTTLTTEDQDKIEIKILNAVTAAGLGLVGGLGEAAAAVAGALGEIGDPVTKILGFKAQGPCNGPVFSDAVPFTGSGLDSTVMTPLQTPTAVLSTISFTKTYTDEATHNTDICGRTAETDVTFSVFRHPFISVRELLEERFPSTFPGQFGPGIRQHAQSGTSVSLKSLLGLRP